MPTDVNSPINRKRSDQPMSRVSQLIQVARVPMQRQHGTASRQQQRQDARRGKKPAPSLEE